MRRRSPRRSDLGPLRPFQASVPLYRGPRGPVRLRGDSQGAAPFGRGSLGQPGGSRSPTQVVADVSTVPAPGPGLGSYPSEGSLLKIYPLLVFSGLQRQPDPRTRGDVCSGARTMGAPL